MSKRKIYEGLPLPAFLRAAGLDGTRARGATASRRASAASAPSTDASLHGRRRRNPRADRPERRRQDHAVQSGLGPFPDRHGHHHASTAARSRACRRSRICHQGLARSFQITNLFSGLSIYENLRLSLQAQHAGRFNLWRDVDSYDDSPRRDRGTDQVSSASKASRTIEGGELSYGGQRLVDLGIALGSSRRCCCSTSRWRAWRPPSASASRTWSGTWPRTFRC